MCDTNCKHCSTTNNPKGSDKMSGTGNGPQDKPASPAATPPKKAPAKKAASKARAPRNPSPLSAQAVEQVEKLIDLKVEQKLVEVRELVANGTNVQFAAKLKGLSEDDVRRALRIPAGTNLSNEVFMTALVSRVAKNRSGVEKAHARASQLEKRADATETEVTSLKERLSNVEGFLGTQNLDEALKAGKLGGRKSFIQELRDRKVSDDDIRRVLVIVDDGNGLGDMSDEKLFYELYSAFDQLRATVHDNHAPRIAQLEEVVGPEGENIVTRDNVREVVEEIVEDSNTIPVWGWILGFIVGLIVWFLVWVNPIGSHGVTFDTDHHVSGNWIGAFHSGWLGLGLGIIAGCIVALLTAGMSTRRKTTSTSTTSARETSRSGRKPSVWDNFRSRKSTKEDSSNTRTISVLEDREEETPAQREAHRSSTPA